MKYFDRFNQKREKLRSGYIPDIMRQKASVISIPSHNEKDLTPQIKSPSTNQSSDAICVTPDAQKVVSLFNRCQLKCDSVRRLSVFTFFLKCAMYYVGGLLFVKSLCSNTLCCSTIRRQWPYLVSAVDNFPS